MIHNNTQVAGADPGFDKGVNHAEHKAQACNGGLGVEPQHGPGAEPHEAESLLSIFIQKKDQMLRI